ncbi:MAG: hypothetical protein L3K17_04330 [Thermoplasmata archaeon]|nr:hypothetical protein [Thermoplasmata archaeon]
MSAQIPPHVVLPALHRRTPAVGPLALSLFICFLLLVPVAAASVSSVRSHPTAQVTAPGSTSTGPAGAATPTSGLEGAIAPADGPRMVAPDHSLALLNQERGRGVPAPAAQPHPSAFDTQTGTVFMTNGSINKGILPTKNVAGVVAAAYDPDNHTVFVAGAYTSSVGQYVPQNGSIATFTQLGSLIYLPNLPVPQISALAYDSQLGLLFAASANQGGVWAINAVNGTPVAFYLLGPAAAPDALALDASGATLFVADEFNDSVAEVNAATGQIERNATVGVEPDALAYDPTGSKLFVANYLSNNVSIIDPTTGASTGAIAVGTGPESLSIVPSGDSLWTLNQGSGNVTIYSGGALTSVSLPATSAGNATSLILDPARNTMFVLNAPQGKLAAYNATSHAGQAAVNLGGLPWAAAYDPAQGYLEITTLSSNSLTEVDDATDAVAHVFRLGAFPMASAYSAVAGLVYVADPSVYLITELDARTDAVVGTIALASPGYGLAYSSAANLLAVIEVDGAIAFVSTSTGAVAGTWSPGDGTTFFAGVYGNGEFFFTANAPLSGPSTYGDEIFVVSASGFALINVVVAGHYDNGLTYDATTRYVDVVSNRSVLEVSTVTDNLFGQIAIPGFTNWSGVVTWDNVSNELYVTAFFTAVVAILNLTNSSNDATLNLGTVAPFTGNLDPTAALYVRQTNMVYLADVLTGYTFSIVRIGAFAYVPASAYSGVGPAGLAYSVLSGILYVANGEAGTLGLLTITPNVAAPMFVELSISPATVQLGAAVTLQATATYPEWSDNFTYTGLPATCPSVNKTLWSCTAGAPNSFTVTVKAKNPFGFSATTSASFAVFQPLTLASFTATPSVLTLGSTFRTLASYSGGVSPVTVGYPIRPTGCAATTSLNWTCTPTAAGNYTLELDISDANGNSQEANLSVVVNPHLAILFALSTNSTLTGHAVSFTVAVTGGTAPFTFTYTGLPAGCNPANATTITCSPTTSGVYPVLVKVVDSNAASASSTVTLVVSSSGSSGNNGGGALSTTDLLLIVVIVVIAAIAVIALATRRKGPAPARPARRPPPPPDEEEEEPAGESEPPSEPEAPGEMIMPPPQPERPIIPVAAAAPMNNPSAPGAGAIEGEPERQYYTGSNVEAASTAGSQRPSLVCPKCGTVNESWLTNCRKCKRSLFSTGGA